jgi:hypothetical protein
MSPSPLPPRPAGARRPRRNAAVSVQIEPDPCDVRRAIEPMTPITTVARPRLLHRRSATIAPGAWPGRRVSRPACQRSATTSTRPGAPSSIRPASPMAAPDRDGFGQGLAGLDRIGRSPWRGGSPGLGDRRAGCATVGMTWPDGRPVRIPAHSISPIVNFSVRFLIGVAATNPRGADHEG